MNNICRLCLSSVSYSPMIAVYSDEIPLEDKIKYLLPEIDLNVISPWDLCNLCTQLLSTAYCFKHACLKTEETLQKYISQYGKDNVDLNEVKEFQIGDASAIHEDIGETIKNESAEDGMETESKTLDVVEQSDASFICYNCDEAFEVAEQLAKHREKCEPYKCDQCLRILDTKDEYDKHCEVHSIFEIQGWSESNEIDDDKSELHNEKSSTCDVCQFVCSSQLKLKRHKLSHRILPRDFHCNLCNNTYSQLRELRTHKITHKLDKDKRCTICNTIFHTMQLLQEHVASQHPIVCEICGFKCGLKSTLTKHIRTHTGERPYVCAICSKTFSRSSARLDHMRNIHNTMRPYKCKICDKSYGVATSLRRHLKVHSKPIENVFHCLYEGCYKKYRTMEERATHLKEHTDEEALKTYQCSYCENMFSKKAALKRHMQCHMGEKPFQCHRCHERFLRRDYLEKHFQSHKHKRKDETITTEEITIEDEEPALQLQSHEYEQEDTMAEIETEVEQPQLRLQSHKRERKDDMVKVEETKIQDEQSGLQLQNQLKIPQFAFQIQTNGSSNLILLQLPQ